MKFFARSHIMNHPIIVFRLPQTELEHQDATLLKGQGAPLAIVNAEEYSELQELFYSPLEPPESWAEKLLVETYEKATNA